MRHLVALPVIAGCLAFGGCATTGSVNTSVTSTEAAAFLAEVQQYASLACAFEPTAITVAEIAAASNAGASTGVALAKQIAGQICAAVTAKSARRGVSYAPHVGRVRVHGTFDNGRTL